MRRIAISLLLIGACCGGCSESPTVQPSALSAGAPLSQNVMTVTRPVNGRCATSFTFLATPPPEGCATFQAAPSAFLAITGECQIAHLGRSTTEAVQQQIFALNAAGQPLLVDGQPVVRELRNCGTFTAANGDHLHFTAVGPTRAGNSPGTVLFEGSFAFVGGSGRFESSSGTATFSGGASLMSNTGDFSFEGSLLF